MQSLSRNTTTGDAGWPPNIPRPDVALAKYRDCKSAGSVSMWARQDGSVTTRPYPCRDWSCREHHGEKADEYRRAFWRYLDQLPAVYVGGFRDAWMRTDAVTKASNSIKQRATDRGGVSYVRVRSGGAYVWFTAADLSLSRPRAESIAPTFTRVSHEQAADVFAYLLRRLDVAVSGNRTAPVWRSPDRYNRDGGGSGSKYVSSLPRDDREWEAARSIQAVAEQLLPNPLSPAERDEWMETGRVPGGFVSNDGHVVQEKLVEAGGLARAEYGDVTPAESVHSQSTPRARHLRALPAEPGDGATSNEGEAA